MMDRVTRRSACASLVLHGVLVATSLSAFGPPPPPPPPPARTPAGAPPPPPAQPPAELAPVTIAAEDAVVSASRPRLPALGAATSALPPLPIIRATPTDRQGEGRSRGEGGTDRAEVALPRMPADESPALRALRGGHVNPAMTHEQKTLATAQEYLEGRLVANYHGRWRNLRTQISNRRLVVWLVTDKRGFVQRGGLFACSTGSADLDRGIERLLLEKDFGLPPIAPGVVTYFAVTLP